MMNVARITEKEILEIQEMTDFELRLMCEALEKLIKKADHTDLIAEMVAWEMSKRISNN